MERTGEDDGNGAIIVGEGEGVGVGVSLATASTPGETGKASPTMKRPPKRTIIDLQENRGANFVPPREAT